MQGIARFVVSAQASSVALGLEDTEDYCMRRHDRAQSRAT